MPGDYSPGLEGVIAFETEIAEPDKDGGALRYRGVDIEDLVGNVSFGNVWGLLVDGKFITLRVPYPMGFYAKGLDGRIDNPNGGWKGRSIWVGAGTRVPWMQEGIDAKSPGAPGATPASPYVYQVQLRPNPLAL